MKFKYEVRIPKSETISNDQNSNDKKTGVSKIEAIILFLSLGRLIFEFVSNFDIRISDFPDGIFVNFAI